LGTVILVIVYIIIHLLIALSNPHEVSSVQPTVMSDVYGEKWGGNFRLFLRRSRVWNSVKRKKLHVRQSHFSFLTPTPNLWLIT